MLNKTASILLLALLLLGFAAGPAAAQDPAREIRTMLEQRDREIKRLLGDRDTFTPKQRADLQALINGVIDFESMARTALGPHWKTLTPQQRSEFVTVFSDIVRAQSLADLDVYRSRVTYDQIKVDGEAARVLTTTVYKDVPMNVAYLLKKEDKSWWVEDIILDEVSTAEGYARSFQTVVRKKGFDALMTSLRKRRDQIETSK